MAERNVLADGLKRCNRGAVRLFRNSVGVGYVCRGKPVRLKDGRLLLKGASAVRFGLAVGSGDTIGFRQVTITTEMEAARSRCSCQPRRSRTRGAGA